VATISPNGVTRFCSGIAAPCQRSSSRSSNLTAAYLDGLGGRCLAAHSAGAGRSCCGWPTWSVRSCSAREPRWPSRPWSVSVAETHPSCRAQGACRLPDEPARIDYVNRWARPASTRQSTTEFAGNDKTVKVIKAIPQTTRFSI
jgi:hypothetical protein